jgi:type II secretory pathway component PulF
MPLYAYRYLGPEGPKVGYMEAESEEALFRTLQEQNILPLEVSQVRRQGARKLSPRILATYFRQLKSLIQVGGALSLSQVLSLLEEQLPKWAQTRHTYAPRSLERGISLPQALAGTGLFPNLVIATLRVADRTAKNEEAAERLAQYYARVARFQAKVRGALTYPTLVLLFALLTAWALMTFIVPQFVRILEETQVPIPLITKVTILASKAMSSPLFIGLSLLVLLLGVRALQAYLRDPTNRLRFEQLLFRVPILGRTLIHNALADTAGALKLAYESGIPLHESLTLTRNVVALEHFRELLSGTREALIRGMSLTQAFTNAPHSELLPTIFRGLINVGETGGSLEDMLDHAERIYAEEVENTLDNVSSVIEPLLLILVGTVIGGIMLSVLLPYFGLIQSIGGGGGGAP